MVDYSKDTQIHGESVGLDGIRVYTFIGDEGLYTLIDIEEESKLRLAEDLGYLVETREFGSKHIKVDFVWHSMGDIKAGNYVDSFNEHVDSINTVFEDLGIEGDISYGGFMSCVAYQTIGAIKSVKYNKKRKQRVKELEERFSNKD